MNFRKVAVFVAVALTAGVACSAFAQGGGQARLYNPATEATVQGSVSAVTTVTGRRGWNGVHLTVQTSEGKYDVHIGPSDYIASKEFTFSEGDQVEVTGSKLEVNGTSTLIAREIKKDGKVLTLRDKQGFPLWSRGRMMTQ